MTGVEHAFEGWPEATKGKPLGEGAEVKGLVYHGPGEKSWENVPDPSIVNDTDALVRIDSTTI